MLKFAPVVAFTLIASLATFAQNAGIAVRQDQDQLAALERSSLEARKTADAATIAAKTAKEKADEAVAAAKQAQDLADQAAVAEAARQTQLREILARLHPNGWEHFARSLSLSGQFAQQPAMVTVDNVLVPTPQAVLSKGSLTITPSEFFATPSDVSSEVTAWTKAGGVLGQNVKEGICHDSDAFVLARCVVRARKRDFLYRALSGFTGTLSYSENLRVKNGTLIVSGSDAAKKNNQWSGSVTFSATNLFLTGADWQSGESAAAAYSGSYTTSYVGGPNGPTTVHREFLRLIRRRCGITDVQTTLVTEDCVKHLAGPTGWKAFGASLIPDVTYQLQTQFDFVKSGNAYVQYAGLQPSLWTVSAKLDMMKAITSAKSRLAALQALVAAEAQERKDTVTLQSPPDPRP